MLAAPPPPSAHADFRRCDIPSPPSRTEFPGPCRVWDDRIVGPRYAQYFEGQWQALDRQRLAAGLQFTDQVQLAVIRGIEAADIRSSIAVRPDARQFLAVNLQDMVVQPAAAVEPNLLRELVGQILPQDVRQIARAAARSAEERGSDEVSAHGMLQAMADEWPNLGFAAPWRWEK